MGCPGERLVVTFLSGILGVLDGRTVQRLSSSEFWAWKYPRSPCSPAGWEGSASQCSVLCEVRLQCSCHSVTRLRGEWLWVPGGSFQYRISAHVLLTSQISRAPGLSATASVWGPQRVQAEGQS